MKKIDYVKGINCEECEFNIPGNDTCDLGNKRNQYWTCEDFQLNRDLGNGEEETFRMFLGGM